MNYRTYECYRNSGGGLDPTGEDWGEIEAKTAQDAAAKAAANRKALGGCDGLVMVATDDNGDSAQADVN